MDKNAFLINLSGSNRTEFGKVPFEMQSYPQRVFSAIWSVESEVNNGGFVQYFENSSCETAAFVAEALDTVGAPLTATICRRAIAAAFPRGLPRDPEEISAKAEDLSDEIRQELEEIGDEFFKYPHSLTDLLFDYVSKHPNEFGPVPNAS
jgi:uncharacterized protein DUF4375